MPRSRNSALIGGLARARVDRLNQAQDPLSALPQVAAQSNQAGWTNPGGPSGAPSTANTTPTATAQSGGITPPAPYGQPGYYPTGGDSFGGEHYLAEFFGPNWYNDMSHTMPGMGGDSSPTWSIGATYDNNTAGAPSGSTSPFRVNGVGYPDYNSYVDALTAAQSAAGTTSGGLPITPTHLSTTTPTTAPTAPYVPPPGVNVKRIY